MKSYNVSELMRMTNIEINKEELNDFVDSVDKVLDWCASLESIDTKGIEPMYSVFDILGSGLQNLREDVVYDGNYQDKILMNTADKEDIFICVPKVIEQQ